MTAKEKANQLCLKFSKDGLILSIDIKAALIVVEEVLEANPHIKGVGTNYQLIWSYNFWIEVRKELEKL